MNFFSVQLLIQFQRARVGFKTKRKVVGVTCFVLPDFAWEKTQNLHKNNSSLKFPSVL